MIVIHGVNDLGVSYGDVEAGVCEGLNRRLWPQVPEKEWPYRASPWRNYDRSDSGRLDPDLDAAFFRRKPDGSTYSPVVHFYWGFREDSDLAKRSHQTKHGRCEDRYGNRLDLDLSKEGGAFSNATNTLQDMWNKGQGGNMGTADAAMRDPYRPVLACPGRMYMILAAKRLAAVISMIRDYDENEIVNLVAHSQGCMLSLLAQAFLVDQKLRPADTLILTHPPYSLDEKANGVGSRSGGSDFMMDEDAYKFIEDDQTMGARLSTLRNIVKAVEKNKNTVPAISTLKDPKYKGIVGARWDPSLDRDNRGKVYLYFCPEDSTVALKTVKGMGWQGVPDFIDGTQWSYVGNPATNPYAQRKRVEVTREPMKEMKGAFFQRVFTARKRNKELVKVGQEPHDFALRMKWDWGLDHAAEASPLWNPINNFSRADTDYATDPPDAKRTGWRTINGEKLQAPVPADMYAGGAVVDPSRNDKERDKKIAESPPGAWEDVDAADADIAATSDYGWIWIWQLVDEKPGTGGVAGVLSKDGGIENSPFEKAYAGKVRKTNYKAGDVLRHFNEGKPAGQQTQDVKEVYTCVDGFAGKPTGRLLIKRRETGDETALRHQRRGLAPRSFHGAIFGSRKNHCNVTAYDLSIGGGKATTDPGFGDYLRAVADWRIRKASTARPGFMTQAEFEKRFSVYLKVEPEWRRHLIDDTIRYFSTGKLPKSLPVLPQGAPTLVHFETKSGWIIAPGIPYPIWYKR